MQRRCRLNPGPRRTRGVAGIGEQAGSAIQIAHRIVYMPDHHPGDCPPSQLHGRLSAPTDRSFETYDQARVDRVKGAAHRGDLEERIRAMLTQTARRGGLPDGRLAEAFRVLDTG